ncbi:Uncharacterized protein OS=Candidatus Entotheonella sp. TSY2 GN=ETSY2_31115 PE=4 SV=1: VWA_2 [Tuwongella immobilis]|uniref:VWFA domain-containing protein n=1 Tax=Tuwongella immobilis TaxID=692036 RepID=A0A6C2YJI7_9BACT|nr:Uncharacterized protein OS=Candidatus Entotheonella sp. TSY2 GN=ETSY2_31115 PE=4 SV=1: VWA_2 [Tuwongella immobilis]VTR97976.1 Uncharacterized protein OS=Candidatus Entotheonella sp. TSY2 GN=ETSY2_31115 PE=4 SV=1: VWA_2 [Tuwongella immobilis]
MWEFTTPWALVGLPLIAGWAWWCHRRSVRALPFSDLRLIPQFSVGNHSRIIRIPGWLEIGMLVAMVVAIAEPRRPDPDSRERLPSDAIAMVIVLDTSGSMGAVDFPERPGGPLISRLDAARRTLRLVLLGGPGPNGEPFPGRMGDQIGLVTFSSWPDPVCPLTLAHSVLLRMLDDVRPSTLLTDGSNVGDAIVQGLLLLERATPQRKLLLLLSDGEHNFERDGDAKPKKPRQAAQLAAAMGVPILAIDIGGEPIPPRPGSDESAQAAYQQRLDGRATLTRIAELTQGQMLPASNALQLQDAFQQVDRLERTPVPSYRYRETWSARPLLIGIALILGIGAWLLRWTIARVIPS